MLVLTFIARALFAFGINRDELARCIVGRKHVTELFGGNFSTAMSKKMGSGSYVVDKTYKVSKM